MALRRSATASPSLFKAFCTSSAHRSLVCACRLSAQRGDQQVAQAYGFVWRLMEEVKNTTHLPLGGT
jgi:hypothetical protein